jgi:hypothetical protein
MNVRPHARDGFRALGGSPDKKERSAWTKEFQHFSAMTGGFCADEYYKLFYRMSTRPNRRVASKSNSATMFSCKQC